MDDESDWAKRRLAELFNAAAARQEGAAEALAEGRRSLEKLKEETDQYESFFQLTGMRASLAERIALAQLRCLPNFPLDPRAMARLWNEGLVTYEHQRQRFRLSTRKLRALVFAGALGQLVGFVPAVLFFSLANAGGGAMASIVYLTMMAVFLAYMAYFAWTSFVPVIRAYRLKPLIDPPPTVPSDG